MKRILLTLFIMAFCIAIAEAQPRGHRPKKSKGNHSNGRTALGFSSPTSVMYDIQLSSVSKSVNTIPGTQIPETDHETQVTSASFMTPTGWGSKETFAFATFGGTPVQPYGGKQNPDFLAQLGFGTGNFEKNVSVVGILNINDVSKVNNLSASFIASRKLGKTTSISAGAIHLFADSAKTDVGSSYYIAFSQAIRNTKFNYTIGIGSGRFYNNSEYDIENGKKEHGTGVFANISYAITKNISVSTEWTGLNLCVASSVRFKPKWPVLSLGVTDITRISADKPSFYFSLGQALVFNKGKR